MVTDSQKNLGHSMAVLLSEGLQGNQQAYQQFLVLAAGVIRRFIVGRIPAQDVEDVVQEILFSLHKARHTHDGQRPLLPWIIAIARYRMADYLRKYYATHQQQQVDISELENFLKADVTITDNFPEYLEEQLEQLPARQQKILSLLHEEGLSAKEVGQQLNMKETAVKVAAHRAYKLIKARLSS
ncbi:MAG: sigma-70 family RNA polymerase sigma factor [Alphaproteobacteria bacterium]